MWNLKNIGIGDLIYKAEVENKCMDTKGEGEMR